MKIEVKIGLWRTRGGIVVAVIGNDCPFSTVYHWWGYEVDHPNRLASWTNEGRYWYSGEVDDELDLITYLGPLN